jgi:predicted ATPase
MAGQAAWRFGRCELRPATRELLLDGRPQKLGERAFDLLLALAEAEGRPVSRDDLFDRAWPGRAVLEDNLKVQVMALRRLLGTEAVVTVPGQGYRLGLPRLDASPPPDLFGRDADLDRLLQRLAPGRLLTLVGPGGIGKTRLALAAAAQAGPADGTLVVELAPLADPRALAGTVARALALPPGAGEAALLAALKPLALRLVLDNAEHLHDAVAGLAEQVLEAAPGVTLLVTSQEPLGLAGEQVLRLDGLAVPADDSAAALAASPAAALFAARAAALGFAPGPADAAALARLCRRLDGIPLALELAAARVPLLGVAGVERHLDEALALLTRGHRGAPPRQQTLRGALQWSHGLLDDAQKAVFRRLAVFAGGFSLEFAQAVAGAG